MQYRAVLDEVRAALAGLAITDARAAEAELEKHNERRRTVWGDRAAVLPIARGSAEQVLRTIESCLENDFVQRGATEAYIENRGDAQKIIVKVIFSQAFGRHEILRTGPETYAAMVCTAGAEMPQPRIARPAARKPLVITALIIFALAIVAAVSMLMRASAREGELTLVARVTMAQVDAGGPLRVAYVNHGFFSNTRMKPQYGRFFQPSDAGTLPRLAVISDSLFAERYARNPGAALGTVITIGGDEVTICGVGPERFNEPGGAQLWIAGR